MGLKEGDLVIRTGPSTGYLVQGRIYKIVDTTIDDYYGVTGLEHGGKIIGTFVKHLTKIDIDSLSRLERIIYGLE